MILGAERKGRRDRDSSSRNSTRKKTSRDSHQEMISIHVSSVMGKGDNSAAHGRWLPKHQRIQSLPTVRREDLLAPC